MISRWVQVAAVGCFIVACSVRATYTITPVAGSSTERTYRVECAGADSCIVAFRCTCPHGWRELQGSGARVIQCLDTEKYTCCEHQGEPHLCPGQESRLCELPSLTRIRCS